MALVAYDNSDSSEFEDEEDQNITVPTLTSNVQGQTVSPSRNGTVEPSSSQNLFNFLPRPSTKKAAVIEEDDEFLHKKDTVANITKPKAKITVPSLSDFKDVADRPTAKPRVPSDKKSGLLSMLPQPRNPVTTTTKSLVPHVLTKKPTTTAKKKEPLPTPLKNKKAEVISYSDDSDPDDDTPNDFFSINKPIELPPDNIPLDIDKPRIKSDETSQKTPRNLESYFKQDTVESPVESHLDDGEASSNSGSQYYGGGEAGSSYNNGHGAPETSSNDMVLDEEAILKLCGTRGKRKREEIQIVDVNQQEVLADARQWLLKGLMDDTTKRVSASKRRGDEPTSQQRRKHQITYLAHQAKANEAELQNQWANNRQSKRQTQSKYGF